MKYFWILLLLLLIIINGCHPDSFVLHKNKDDVNSKIRQINGLIMSDLDSFEKLDDNSFILKENAIVAMRVRDITQLRAQFLVELIEGNGLTFNFHSVSNWFDIHNKISLKYYNNEISIWKDTTSLYQNYAKKIDTNRKEWVIYENYGNNLTIILGCDTIFNKRINSISTEYVILETGKNTEVKLESVLFSDINKQ